MTTVVLVTGEIGTGTSDVLRILAGLGHATIDADDLAYQALRRGGAGYQRLLDRFGAQILDGQGELDRLLLHQLARLEARAGADIRSIVFPLVRRQLEDFISQTTSPVVFIELHDPTAYGAGQLADLLWTVTASNSRRIENLQESYGWRGEPAAKLVRAQRERQTGRPDADVIIRSDVSEAELSTQLSKALGKMGIGRTEPTRELPLATVGAPAAPPPAQVVTEEPVASLPSGAGAPSAAARSQSMAPAKIRSLEAAPATETRAASLGMRELRLVGRRVVSSILILLAIAFLTFWGLIVAEYGREHLPIGPMRAAAQAIGDTVNYISAHPQSYYWAKDEIPWLQLVGETLRNSAGLLLLSMTAAIMLGFPLGMAAARSRRGPGSALMVLLSVAGASTPSFLFGMLLWAANIWVHRTFDIKVLPATGFGWDAHLIMPVMVLAMRPLAQVAQITYVSVRAALDQDYIRTAHSKGLTWRAIQNVHLLPNTLIPILNTLGASLRFSLASLPVVEIFFHWPGVGSRLLDAIGLGNSPLVVDLILSLGLFFLLVNLLIEFSFPLIDPRLRSDATAESRTESGTVTDVARQAGEILAAWFQELRTRLRRGKSTLPPLPRMPNAGRSRPEALPGLRHRSALGNMLRNPALLIGLLMLIVIAVLTLVGERLPGVDPYQRHGVMSINGEYSAPPFEISREFPWGSDHIGRDIRSLVIAGTRRTMTLAFFGMLARLVLGGTLGLLAGWQRGSWLDRVVSGATAIWAAFPATLFAMIVIQALGIQQGMWVFVAAISVVGWGEVAQIVRAHVATLKPQAFMESARSIGARADQVLLRHVLPNLVNPLTVLAALEMGGILMLLAELGFLDIFMGGGFRVIIGEQGAMVPIVATYSDVPEWSALIANVREYWRSYPWMALYPGMAIFLAIMAFNLFAEGLRHFLEQSALAVGRLLNRYAVIAVSAGTLVLALVLRSAAPLSLYRPDGLRFEPGRSMQDVRVLSDTQMQGRETGLAGADLAAIYIAERMAEIGLMPGGEHNGYYQRLVQPRIHLMGVPGLSALDTNGAVAMQFEYRTDFSEFAQSSQSRGVVRGAIMGVAYGPAVEGEDNSQFGLSSSAAMDHVIIVRAEDVSKVVYTQVMAVLVVADRASDLQRRDVYPYLLARSEDRRPILQISSTTADTLLRTAGSTLAQLDEQRAELGPKEISLTGEGMNVEISLEAERSADFLNEAYINVIGVIPGQGYLMGTQEKVIIVSAYYDGLGTDPLGVVYPGANDNASGVAVMLELARLLKSSSYQPDKTVLFVAWAGGERQEGMSITNIMNARAGASRMTVETVIELAGVGHGTGEAIAIGNESSYRLTQLFQKAAARYDAPTTTLGRGPHHGLPVGYVFGGREAATLSVAWDGSDQFAHTAQDTLALIDAEKLRQVGQSMYLTMMVLSRETEY